jgi:hypothetical protein
VKAFFACSPFSPFAPFARFARFALLPAALGLLSSTAAAAPGDAPADHGAVPASQPEPEELPAYHHSIFSWEHSVTTQTVGVGDTPQSSNPTYNMGFVAKTRYYLLDDTPAGKHFSLRLDGGLYREFTSSDSTTRRGEWTFSDTELAAVYARRFRGPADTDGTLAEVRPLTLSLPTSKASYASGRYFAAGALVGVTNVAPLLRGKVQPQIQSLVRLTVGYKRWFARASVPTNESLERVRLTPDGRSLPGDSLSGASLVRDQVDLTARLRLDFGEDVVWTTDFAFSPAWKYPVQNDVQLCGVVLTGCTNVQVSPDATRYLVQTLFNTEVSVRVAPSLSVELGYGNTTGQIGPDGRRRGFFYSPDATFYASVSFTPHELAIPPSQIAQSQSAPPRF